jgi:heptosyltransferase-2
MSETKPRGADVPPGGRLKLDCRHYRGDRPCARGVQGVCPAACDQYLPLGRRILVIKLGALGDVIRTAALLPGLKESWPHSHITWVSRPNGVRMLAHHPLIDRLLPLDAETLCHLEYERFDLCINLDKEPGPAALAMRVDAADKRGIGLSAYGTTYPLNAEGWHYFELGLSDTLKFRENTQSYQQLIYEAVGLPYRGQRYTLHPSDADVAHAARAWSDLGVDSGAVVVGLNTGAGRVFAHKNWPAEKYIALMRVLHAAHREWRVALLGGPEERATNAHIARLCPAALDTGTHHTELQFAALVQRCTVLVTGDTMALHVGVATRTPCIVLFGPTCAQEINLYGQGEKLLARLPCAPCYRRTCDKQPHCMDDIEVAAVLAAIERWTPADRTRPTRLPLAEVTA